MAEKTKAKRTADVTAQRVARVYAEALLNAAEKHGQGDAVLEEYRSLIEEVFSANPQVEILLSSAALGRTKRKAALERVFEKRASAVFFNFVLVLNNHERLELLRPILVALQDLHDERARKIRVQVLSAALLPAEQQDRLAQEIRDAFGLEPILETETDPELLGGLKVRVGDWQFDGSLRTQLESIRSEILERSSHEIQSRRDRFSTADGN